jgi:hypothetical protein
MRPPRSGFVHVGIWTVIDCPWLNLNGSRLLLREALNLGHRNPDTKEKRNVRNIFSRDSQRLTRLRLGHGREEKGDI